MSRKYNGLIVSNASNVDALKYLLATSCLHVDKVSPEIQPRCFSLADPRRPERYLRSCRGRLAFDVDHSPRNRETFDQDASFFRSDKLFYPGYLNFQSVSNPRSYMKVSSQGQIRLSYVRDTAEFRNMASFAVRFHHTKST